MVSDLWPVCIRNVILKMTGSGLESCSLFYERSNNVAELNRNGPWCFDLCDEG